MKILKYYIIAFLQSSLYINYFEVYFCIIKLYTTNRDVNKSKI